MTGDATGRDEAFSSQEARRNDALRKVIGDMVFFINADGRYTGFESGPGLAPLVPPEVFLGKLVVEVLPPQVAEPAMNAIRAALRTQELQVVHYELGEGEEARQYEARIAAAGDSEVLAVVRDETALNFVHDQVERQLEVDALEARAEAAMLGPNPYGLSFREFTVLDLIADGRSDREISDVLGCSQITVRRHVASTLTKLGAKSRTEGAVLAIRRGMVPLPE